VMRSGVRSYAPRLVLTTTKNGRKRVRVRGNGVEALPMDHFVEEADELEEKFLLGMDWLDENPDASVERVVDEMSRLFSIQIDCEVKRMMVKNRQEPVKCKTGKLNPLRYRSEYVRTLSKYTDDWPRVRLWAVLTNEKEITLFVPSSCTGNKVDEVAEARARLGYEVTHYFYISNGESLDEPSSDEECDSDDSVDLRDHEDDDRSSVPSVKGRLRIESDEESDHGMDMDYAADRRVTQAIRRNLIEESDDESDHFTPPPKRGRVEVVQQPHSSVKECVPCPHCDASIDIEEMKAAIYWSEKLRKKYLPCSRCDVSIDIDEMKTAIYWSERLRSE
jgi:hypothetical protein